MEAFEIPAHTYVQAISWRSGDFPEKLPLFILGVLLSAVTTPTMLSQQLQHRKVPSKRRMLRRLGIPHATGLRMYKSVEDKRRAVRNNEEISDWQLTISRKGFWKKVSLHLRK